MDKKKKTHALVSQPQMSVRELADYMAGSERKKRAVVEGCKYRTLARVIQHKEARIIIANALRKGETTLETFKEKADFVRSKMATDDFDALVNEANADYIERFGKIIGKIHLPDAQISPGKTFPTLNINGLKITFVPDLILRRTTKTNKLKRGAVMLRYAKGKPLATEIANYQSSAIFALLGEHKDEDGSEPEKSLCITLDGFTGTLHPAPGKAVSNFANMKAACKSIVERWPNIPPPEGAIL
jgi:hypothetical protein